MQSSILISQALGALTQMADSYYRAGRLNESSLVLRAAGQLLELRDIKKQDQLRLLLQSATILVAAYFCTNQDDDQMLSIILQAKRMAEDLQDDRSLADALSLLGQASYFAMVNSAGSLSSTQADYKDALAHQQEALRLREAIKDTRGISESLFYIGLIYERQQQYDQAVDYYLKVIALADQHRHLFEKCEATRHLAGIAWYRGDLQQALSRAEEALALREQISFQLYLPFDLILLGQICLTMNDLKPAQDYYQRGYDIASEIGLRQAEMFSALGLGEIQERQSRAEEAVHSYERALVIARELEIPRAVAKATECLERYKHQHN